MTSVCFLKKVWTVYHHDWILLHPLALYRHYCFLPLLFLRNHLEKISNGCLDFIHRLDPQGVLIIHDSALIFESRRVRDILLSISTILLCLIIIYEIIKNCRDPLQMKIRMYYKFIRKSNLNRVSSFIPTVLSQTVKVFIPVYFLNLLLSSLREGSDVDFSEKNGRACWFQWENQSIMLIFSEGKCQAFLFLCESGVSLTRLPFLRKVIRKVNWMLTFSIISTPERNLTSSKEDSKLKTRCRFCLINFQQVEILIRGLQGRRPN